MKRILSLLLCLSMIVSSALFLEGCNGKKETIPEGSSKTVILSDGIDKSYVLTANINDAQLQSFYDFSAELLSNTYEENKNTLLSPFSVFIALSMLANGAENETLAELESTLGMSRDELNDFVNSYMASIPKDNFVKLSTANSVWFKDKDIAVYDSFLKANADYYGADIFSAPFDENTLSDINEWISEKTEGLVKDILKKIDPAAVMYLINTLYFDAKWDCGYTEYSVADGRFTTADGTEREVEFMNSTESYYLEDENSTGFIKYYSGGEYAFAALIPNEGISIGDYVKDLDGEKFRDLLLNKKEYAVSASMPKFKTEYSCELPETLKKMGIVQAFHETNADLTSIGESEGNLYVNNVLHKTYIDVNETGTTAGAATVIEVDKLGVCAPEKMKYVTLDRPFIYMIIDLNHNLPLFIGTLCE